MPVSFVRCIRLSKIWRLLVASRCEHAVVDALAVQRQRVGLLLLERVDQALLLRLRRLVVVAQRLDDLGDLALELRLGGLDRRLDLDHVGVAGRRACPTAAPAAAAGRPARPSAAG